MVDVFVDTSAWYALRVSNDGYHQKARLILQRLLARQAWLHTSDWVFVETTALIANRVGRQEAVRAANWILQSGAVRCHPVAEAYEDAWSLFQKLEGRISLVDCGSFALMERLGLERAFAFDEDFARQGLKTEPLE